MATPYYDDGTVTIYHGDCRDILPTLDVEVIVTDPPYGIAWDCDYAGRGMGRFAASASYAPVHGDDEPFDPSWLFERTTAKGFVLFGANHYANQLPPSPGWLVWDKTGNGRHVSPLSDAELAWTNLTGGCRLWSHLWKGMLKDSERGEVRSHPTQKPVALFRWIFDRFATAGVIADPYLGSGPSLRAAKDLGRRAIGIEIKERYCEIAARRLGQEVLAL